MNLNQITLPSLDVARSIAFYESLGFELIVRALPKYARFLSIEGDSTFSIHKVEGLSDSGGTQIYFETVDVDEVVKKLIIKGIKFVKLPVDESWGWREAELHDPDGNRIVLYYGGEFRKNPPWRV